MQFTFIHLYSVELPLKHHSHKWWCVGIFVYFKFTGITPDAHGGQVQGQMMGAVLEQRNNTGSVIYNKTLTIMNIFRCTDN